MVKNLFNLKYFLKKEYDYYFSFFFGALLVLCLPPFNFYYFLFPSLTFLFLKSYNADSNKNAFYIGLLFGISFFLFGLYWIFNSFLVRGGLYFYYIPFLLIILSLFLSIFIGIVSFLNYKFKTNLYFNIIFFSIFWTFCEIIRGYIFTGFPWNLIAHSLSNFEILIQICSIFGVYGLTFFTIIFVLFISIFFINLKERRIIFLYTGLFIFLLIYSFGYFRLKNSNLEEYSNSIFRVVQPNINQKDKLNYSKIEENYKKIIDLSFHNKMGSLNISENLFILWPETAVLNVDHIKSYFIFNKIKKNLKKDELILTGIFKNEKKNSFFNSVIAINNNLEANFIYDKVHLVPFGEYIPFSNYFKRFGFNFNNLEKGSNLQNVVKYKNLPNIKTLICYEIIFPGKFIKNKDEILILNFTNDAWFGKTIGPHQHFVNSIFRSVEEGKQLIRVANTGISGSVDPYGRILNKLQLNHEGYFDTKIFIAKKENINLETVYSKYKNNLIIFLLIILFFLFSILKYKNLKI